MIDDAFLRSCEECTLPFEQWTHRSHVTVAFFYLQKLSFDEALVRARLGIKKYNAANNVPAGPTSGYNETTTQAFFRLIAAAMQAYDESISKLTFDGFCDAHPHLMNRFALRAYYSTEARMHPIAKTEFIEPDLTPFPKVLKGNQ